MLEAITGKVAGINMTAHVQQDMITLKVGEWGNRRMRHNRFLKIRDSVRSGKDSIDVYFNPDSSSGTGLTVIGWYFGDMKTTRAGIIRFVNKVGNAILRRQYPWALSA